MIVRLNTWFAFSAATTSVIASSTDLSASWALTRMRSASYSPTCGAMPGVLVVISSPGARFVSTGSESTHCGLS